MTELTVTGTELHNRLGELLLAAERGTVIYVIDGKHPGRIRAQIGPPPTGKAEGKP